MVSGSTQSPCGKITNGVNLNKLYYAVSLSNIPEGINVYWVKMKSKAQTAWQLASYNSEIE